MSNTLSKLARKVLKGKFIEKHIRHNINCAFKKQPGRQKERKTINKQNNYNML